MKAAPLLFLALAACSPDPGQAREWTRADHDKAEQGGKNQGGRVKQRVEVSDEPELMELTWSKNCQRCHGASGKGDGPMSAAVQAPDLTRSEFLSRATPEAILEIIRSGKGKMPSFETLPARAVDLLVKRVLSGGTPPR